MLKSGVLQVRVFAVGLFRRLGWLCCWGMALAGVAGCTAVPFGTVRPHILPVESLVARQATGCGASDMAAVSRQHFTVLADYRLPGHLRVLHPGQGVTRDLMPDRLNAQVDANGRILRLFCG